MIGMATRKVTLSLDELAWDMTREAAERAGLSPSAWLSAAARREAVRQGAGTEWGDTQAQAAEDDDDWQAAEQGRRRAAG
jgi:hypothetical protein